MRGNWCFRVHEPNVIYERFADETVAIHLATGAYHSMPGIAGEAFLYLTSGPASISNVATRLAEQYDHPEEYIAADLERFFAQLEGQELVVRESGTGETVGHQEIAPENRARLPYTAPQLQSHSDLQELFLIDPVHDVTAAGWPNVKPELALADATPDFAHAEIALAGSHVLLEVIADETVVMNLETTAYFSVTGPAEDVMHLIRQTPTLEEVKVALQSKYNTEAEALEAPLVKHLAELVQAGLIVANPLPSPREARRLELRDAGSNLPFAPLRLISFQEVAAAAGAAPSMANGTFCVRPGEILPASCGSEMIVADRNLGDYYRLNEPARDAFQLLSARSCSVDQVVAALIDKYDVERRQLTGAVMILLRTWVNVQLAIPNAPDPSPAAPTRDDAVFALAANGNKVPFPGFRCDVYKDLRELLSPFNPKPQVTPAKRGSSTRYFGSALAEYFAERCGAPVERSLAVAGAKVQLKFADGTYAEDLTKSVSHLLCPDDAKGASDLTIHVWDGSRNPSDTYFATILDRLFTNWNEACGPRGEVAGIDSPELSALFHPGPDILSVVDSACGQAYFLKRDLSPLPYWEIGSPFRYIFHTWFTSRGVQFVHGGAVGDSRGGVLITAKGGSGKSTTTMLCTKAGMQFAGDDYCLVDPSNSRLHSLYNSSKLKGRDDLTRLPEVTGLSRNPDSFETGGSGKGIYFLSEVWPQQLSAGFPLRAIVIPNVTASQDSRIEPCSAADALLAMMPSTVAQLPAASLSDCERMKALVERLPAYRLHLGSDTSQIAPLVKSLLNAG